MKRKNASKIIRIIAMALAASMFCGLTPAFAYDYETDDFPDQEAYGLMNGYGSIYTGHIVEDYKYLTIRRDGDSKPFSEGWYGKAPVLNDNIVLNGTNIIVEFCQEQTQDIRIELWSVNGDGSADEYLGLINYGKAEGQWGKLGGDQYPFDPGSGIDGRMRISSYFAWDGHYYDTSSKSMKVVGENGEGMIPAEEMQFIIVFQPTTDHVKRFRIEIPIVIDYTEKGSYSVGQLRDKDNVGWGGDPVNMINGNFTWDYTDISVFGAKPLEFTRYYNAQDGTETELGFGWRHTYMIALEKTMNFATVTFADGYRYTYTVMGDGRFVPPEGVTAELKESGGGFVLTEQDKTEYYFNPDGYLTAIVDVGGDAISIARNGGRYKR